jgi:hypothetical protein
MQGLVVVLMLVGAAAVSQNNLSLVFGPVRLGHWRVMQYSLGVYSGTPSENEITPSENVCPSEGRLF